VHNLRFDELSAQGVMLRVAIALDGNILVMATALSYG
jgi:hypothetical protein